MILYYLFNRGKNRYNLIIISLFSLVILISYPKNIIIAVEWVLYLFISYFVSSHMTGNHKFSTLYSVLSLHFGSWLYEIPYFHSVDMFYDERYIFFINSQILSGIFLFSLIYRRDLKFNMSVLYGLLLFVFWEVVFYIRVNYYRYLWGDFSYLSRVGVMLMFLLVLGGFKKEEHWNKYYEIMGNT